MQERERLLQLARLAGSDAFAMRFGPAHTAEPESDALDAFIAEHVDAVGRGLVEEAAASDDVIDTESAQSYLEDRLRDLALPGDAPTRVREAFREGTKAW